MNVISMIDLSGPDSDLEGIGWVLSTAWAHGDLMITCYHDLSGHLLCLVLYFIVS